MLPARENRELEPIGASFLAAWSSANPLPRKAREGKGPSFVGPWSSGDRRGESEVKPQAAGGARSSRSVGSRARSYRGERLTGRSEYPARELGPRLPCGPGFPLIPSFLAFATEVGESMQKRGPGPRAPPLSSQIHWEHKTSMKLALPLQVLTVCIVL